MKSAEGGIVYIYIVRGLLIIKGDNPPNRYPQTAGRLALVAAPSGLAAAH